MLPNTNPLSKPTLPQPPLHFLAAPHEEITTTSGSYDLNFRVLPRMQPTQFHSPKRFYPPPVSLTRYTPPVPQESSLHPVSQSYPQRHPYAIPPLQAGQTPLLQPRGPKPGYYDSRYLSENGPDARPVEPLDPAYRQLSLDAKYPGQPWPYPPLPYQQQKPISMYDQPLQLHPVYVSKYPEYGARDRYMPPPALMPLPPPQGVPGLADYNPVIAGSQYPAPANLVVQSALQGASLPSEIYQRQALDRPKGTTRRAKLSSLLHEAHREPPPEAQEYMPRGPLQYTNYANEVSMPLRRPLDEYGYQNQGYYNADVSTTSQFLQQIAKSQSVNKPSRELKVVDNLLEASSKLPDLDPAESNAANELYLLSGKKYFEKHFEKEVARDISTMYKHIDRHFPMPAKRLKPGKEVAYAPPLVQLGHGQESHLFPRAEILEVKSRLDGYWELQDREEKYKARIGSLKRKMEFLVQQEHQFTGKTETFDGHYDIQSYKRAKFDAIPEFQDPVVQLQEKFINCDELRDYEKKRLQLHSMYLKKRNFRMYIEAFKGEYNNLNKTLVHKLTNLENFFRLQREFLETNRENQEESEMFDITSQDSNKLVAGLGKGIPNDGGLQMSKINKDSGFSEPESSGASARKLRSRVNKRLKNVLDITLKNAKLENASSMNFEIENKDLISSIFEGYSSLTTAEEFFIITENDFSQYHNNPASLKKSLKNNSFNFQRFLKGTSMKRLKSQNILKGLSNDSGSEAKFSSENESSTASSTRRRVIGGGSKDDKNNRTKKPQALKGLTNEELDEDLSVIGT